MGRRRRIYGDDAATRPGYLDGPTIAHHLFGLFSPEAIEEERRKKGEMYGTRMLVVCGRRLDCSVLLLGWRFVVLNRDTREWGLRTWAARDSRRNSSHSGASQEPQNERKLAIRIARLQGKKKGTFFPFSVFLLAHPRNEGAWRLCCRHLIVTRSLKQVSPSQSLDRRIRMAISARHSFNRCTCRFISSSRDVSKLGNRRK